MDVAANRRQEAGHVVLLGDSIFDNGAYVDGGPDLISQLRQELPGWKCSLLAVDGDIIAGVGRQLGGLPVDATHLVVSAGGNDAPPRNQRHRIRWKTRWVQFFRSGFARARSA